MNKKLGAGLAVVIFVIVSLIWLLGTKLDNTVTTVVETTASNVLDTSVTVSNVSIDMKQGKATIGRLSAANLVGYGKEYIIVIESIEADLDINAMQDQLLIIDLMRINNPLISYESNKPSDSNIHDLLKNLRKFSTENDTPVYKDRLRVIIKKLEIGSGVITANSTKSPARIKKVDTPTVEVFNIGQVRGGLSIEEVVNVVAGELVNTVLRTASGARLDLAIKPIDTDWVGAIQKDLEPDG